MRRLSWLLLILPGLALAASGTVSRTFEFAPGDFVFDKVDGFDVVALPGQYTNSEPGKPCLPLAVYNFAIPSDAEVTGATVVEASYAAVPGVFDIHPCQRPQAFSLPEQGFVGKDDATYSSDVAYPEQPVSVTRSGCMGGFRLAGVQLSPMRYVPASGRLEVATRIEVELAFERNRHRAFELDRSQVEVMGGVVRSLVENRDDVDRFAPRERVTDDWLCDMAIVTNSSLASGWQAYADWKTRHGIKTVVIRTDSIYSTYPGRDNQEKIRNCVIDYWEHHGLKWLLVGGDEPVVPVREGRIICEGSTGDIATDLYYADLQYSWDSNNNNLFGEMGDSMDLYYDVFVGRAPVDNAANLANFIAKCTTYTTDPDTGYLKSLLFGSTMLFNPFHGRVINHMLGEFFPGWRQVHLEDPPSGAFRDSMSAGCQLGHVAAHGSQTSFSVMSISQISGLNNGHRKLNFTNSIACNSGWFDGYECIAESLVNCRNGGCIANMFNSRFGYGYPPGFGPSEMLDLEFYRYLVLGAGHQFGSLAALCKDHFQSLTMGQEVWRWCVYELNLFGDPSLSIWTEAPATLAVEHADSALVGAQTFRVRVLDGSTPVPRARVCLMKGTETYARGWTNSQGWVELLVSPQSTGQMELTVNAHDFYPYEGQVPVSGSINAPALVFAGLRVDDNDGNGRLDPGETADLFVSVRNEGPAGAAGVNGTLRSYCPWLTLDDSTAGFGSVPAGQTVEGQAFTVTASGATPPGTVAELSCACASGQGSWEPFFTAPIGPKPPPRAMWLDHDTGEVILSVTSLGSVGTLGPYREGSGMKYPRDAGYGSLYFTSLACGNSPDYIVDRWYGQPSTTYDTDWRAVDTLHPVLPPRAAHEEYEAMVDDADHPTPKGLRVRQWSGALSSNGYRDFVIIQYSLENTGANPINDLHVGIFSDFDVDNTTSNRVYSDANRRLTYMAKSSGFSPTVGVSLLEPTTAANQSAIDNSVHVSGPGMMTEAVKDSFLRGAIQEPNPSGSRNWSMVVSAGPFNLAPGAHQKVAFAFVGGESQNEILRAADSAQSWYDNEMPSGLTWLKHVVDDGPPGGNGDGIINPGEEINLPTWIVNRADGDAFGVRGILRKTSGDTLVTVTDSVRHFGTVGAGDSAFTGGSGFGFRVSRACTNRYQLPLVLVCVDTLDSAFVSTPPLVVGAPQLVQQGVMCWDPRPGGNNNGKLDPDETAELALGLKNVGLGSADSVRATFRSGDARLTVLDSLGWYGPVRPESTVFNSADRFTVQADGSIPRETEIPCTLRVVGHEYEVVRVVMVGVGRLTNVDPIPDGPRTPARYYAYDDCDTFYVAHPDFEWQEISGVGTRLNFSNNDAVLVVNLPSGFGPFRYYGQEYSQVSISADGWVVPGSYTSGDYSNDPLPGSSAPPGVICPNWDDLYPGYSGEGYVYWYHDEQNHRFVIEYDSVPYYSPRDVKDKFELFIYDTTMAGPTGDNAIVAQYLTANRYSSSTVGLQDPGQTVGIQCLYDGDYHRAASMIAPGRAIRYCTDSMVTGVGEFGPSGAMRLELRAAPNPVQLRSAVFFSLPMAGRARLTVHDIAGRLVRTLADAELERGRYTFTWNRKDDDGRDVAAGVYLYRLETDAGNLCRKAVLVR